MPLTKPRHSRSSRLKAGVLSLCATLWVAALSAAEHVIVSVADQVLVYSVDAAKGQLTRIQSLALPDAGPQAVTTDQRTLYISSKVKAGDDGKKTPRPSLLCASTPRVVWTWWPTCR